MKADWFRSSKCGLTVELNVFVTRQVRGSGLKFLYEVKRFISVSNISPPSISKGKKESHGHSRRLPFSSSTLKNQKTNKKKKRGYTECQKEEILRFLLG